MPGSSDPAIDIRPHFRTALAAVAGTWVLAEGFRRTPYRSRQAGSQVLALVADTLHIQGLDRQHSWASMVAVALQPRWLRCRTRMLAQRRHASCGLQHGALRAEDVLVQENRVDHIQAADLHRIVHQGSDCKGRHPEADILLVVSPSVRVFCETAVSEAEAEAVAVASLYTANALLSKLRAAVSTRISDPGLVNSRLD